MLKKLSQSKLSFLQNPQSAKQISAQQAQNLISLYNKKYNINIIFNTNTEYGKQYLDKIKKPLKERLQILDSKNLHFAYFLMWMWEINDSNFNTYAIHLLYGNFVKSYYQIKNAISAFLINNNLTSELQTNIELREKLNNCLKKEFADLFNEQINEYIKTAETYMETASIQINEIHNEIKEIQNNCKKGEIVGYFFSNGTLNSYKHFEVLIISKNYVVKPVQWGQISITLKNTKLYISQEDMNHCPLYSTDLKKILIGLKGNIEPLPQKGKLECGSQGLLYLKELMKNDGYQYNNLSIKVPLYNFENKLVHLFLPSPQVLRYSQSRLYNKLISAMFKTSSTLVEHDDHKILVNSLFDLLIDSMSYANEINDFDTFKKNLCTLAELKVFANKWLDIYENESTIQRDQMQGLDFNEYLSYKSNSYIKKAPKKLRAF